MPMGGSVGLPTPVQEKLADETLGGNMVVDVSANSNTVLKIGLAERAVTLIDFPVDDPVYKIHPGNENFVTVGCLGREPNGKCLNSPTDAIVLRPGKDFHALGSEESAATVITIQRNSGIVVTLIVVPVRRISDNTNYVAVRYDLQNVLKIRRNSGLAVNLQSSETSAAPSSAVAGNASTSGATNGENAQIVNAALPSGDNQTEQTATGAETSAGDAQSLNQMLADEIQRAADNSGALKFSKPVYGIALARTSGSGTSVNDVSVEIIAVRNTLSQAIRLVPDQPELVIENREGKEPSVSVQKVNLLHVATTADDSDVLQPGVVYYYAFAYQSPILGVKQALRVSFAQRAAADAPASIILSSLNR